MTIERNKLLAEEGKYLTCDDVIEYVFSYLDGDNNKRPEKNEVHFGEMVSIGQNKCDRQLVSMGLGIMDIMLKRDNPDKVHETVFDAHWSNGHMNSTKAMVISPLLVRKSDADGIARFRIQANVDAVRRWHTALEMRGGRTIGLVI